MATNPVTTKNQDVAEYCDRANRFLEEVKESNSGTSTVVQKADIKRAKSYLGVLVKYLDFVASGGELDLPKTNPKIIPLDPFNEMDQTIQNEAIKGFCRRFIYMRDEMAKSQSADMGSGMHPADIERSRAYITSFEKYISDFVETETPVDYPESHPEPAPAKK